ncbi:hypothetical protein D3C81_880710 [compost metagenome]
MLQLLLHDIAGIQFRREDVAHAFQTEQRLAQQAQLWRCTQVAAGGDAHDLQHHAAFGDGAVRRVAGDHLPGLAQVALLVVILQPRADGDDFIGHFLATTIHGGKQQLEQALAQPWRHMRHHAQVEDGQLPVGRHPQVARMRVGVYLAVHEDLVEVTAHQGGGQRQHRLLGAAHRRNGIHAYARHQLHGQHAAAAQVPHRLWHPQLGVGRQMLAEAGEAGGLCLVIQLHAQGLGEFIQPIGEAHLAADAGEVVGGGGEAA